MNKLTDDDKETRIVTELAQSSPHFHLKPLYASYLVHKRGGVIGLICS